MAKFNVEIVTKSEKEDDCLRSITSKDIADALMDQHKISIDKRKIVLESPIKQMRRVQTGCKDIPGGYSKD